MSKQMLVRAWKNELGFLCFRPDAVGWTEKIEDYQRKQGELSPNATVMFSHPVYKKKILNMAVPKKHHKKIEDGQFVIFKMNINEAAEVFDCPGLK